ncbi:HsdM family class I SAM-dependent methyltransferase [Nonomuraea jiangxiensis]|uniref:N-6 DNA Methylase n=1 Tax=Nonomuraea jiangxiensis TaxID=633440 RepID=A0A1G8UW65_9ACTN|nr:N-6 DNA methylase [Nonomuraea jiangxiensis]SDJ58106.1 N-6 DNA Methylase [Nonomuraea jiangxiensis]
MSHDPTVNAGDIARLAGVGRAAVSNWRRRHDDFPQPVGGTANQPLFSLRQIESWLRRYGKSYQVSLGDRVWQRLKAAGDLHLGELVAQAGALLTREITAADSQGIDTAEAPDTDAAGTPNAGAAGALRAGAAGAPSAGVTGAPSAGATGAPGAGSGDGPEAGAAGDPDAGVAGGRAALDGADPARMEPELAGLLRELAARHDPLTAYEFLCERYLEAHSRQLSVTREDVAELMVRLVSDGGTTLLDPACGVGTLLLAPTRAAPAGPPAAARMLGQDLSETSAAITASRLRLRGIEATIVSGDSMRADGFAGVRADAVVCDPPFNERAWGYEELTGDPRWEYGLPPRGEPELAWVQHCLTHVKPRGLVAILMPPAAASRKAGRRIRANLLRAGALRAVVALPGSDLWLLRRPAAGERPPSDVLILDATADLSAVEPAWAAYLEDRSDQTVRIIDLLADEVDMAPARHQRRDDVGKAYAEARDRFLAAAALPPDLKVLEQPLDQPATTIGDLIKEGLVTTSQAPPKMSADGGDVPVLTSDDVLNGAPPSGLTAVQPGLIAIRPGDVVASYSSVRVISDGGAVLGPHLTLYRVDARRLDPDFLAGFLRAAGGRVTTGSSRFDVRRTRLPRLSLKDQKAYGEAFRKLAVLEDAIRETSTLGQALIRLGLDGLADGHLHPPAHGLTP